MATTTYTARRSPPPLRSPLPPPLPAPEPSPATPAPAVTPGAVSTPASAPTSSAASRSRASPSPPPSVGVGAAGGGATAATTPSMPGSLAESERMAAAPRPSSTPPPAASAQAQPPRGALGYDREAAAATAAGAASRHAAEASEQAQAQAQAQASRFHEPSLRTGKETMAPSAAAAASTPAYPNPLAEILYKTPIRTVLESRSAPKRLIFVGANDSISDALKKLSHAKVGGAPVVNEHDRVIGFIDVRDISVFVLAAAGDPDKLRSMDVRDIFMRCRTLCSTTVKDAMGVAGERALAVSEDDNIAHVAEIFDQGVHRVAVYDAMKKEVTTVISQTDVVRFIASELEHGRDARLQALADTTLHQLGYTGKGWPLFTVNSDDSVLRAIEKLAIHKVSAVAVTHPKSGRLVGNFSATDLKGLQEEAMPMLMQSVRDFLEWHSPESLKPVAQHQTRTLLQTVQEMLASRVHRVWMIDGEFRPAGIVSMADVVHIALTAKEQRPRPTA